SINHKKSQCRRELLDRPWKIATYASTVGQKASSSGRNRNAGKIRNVLGRLSNDPWIERSLRRQKHFCYRICFTLLQKMPTLKFELLTHACCDGRIDDYRLLGRTDRPIVKAGTSQNIGNRLFNI